VPLALAVAGLDYLLTRNLITAAVPLLLVAAIGFASPRAGRVGPAACAALAVISVGVYAGQEADRAYQRDNWRGAIEAIGHERGPRVVVVPSSSAPPAARVYLPRPARAAADGLAAREIDLVVIPMRRANEPLEPPKPTVLDAPEGFRLVSVKRAGTYAVTRYRAPRLQPIATGSFLGLTNGDLGRVIVVNR
jgi:hypothetical protein